MTISDGINLGLGLCIAGLIATGILLLGGMVLWVLAKIWAYFGSW